MCATDPPQSGHVAQAHPDVTRPPSFSVTVLGPERTYGAYYGKRRGAAKLLDSPSMAFSPGAASAALTNFNKPKEMEDGPSMAGVG